MELVTCASSAKHVRFSGGIRKIEIDICDQNSKHFQIRLVDEQGWPNLNGPDYLLNQIEAMKIVPHQDASRANFYCAAQYPETEIG